MLEFHIFTNHLYAEELSDELSALGAVAVTLQDAGDQPIYEPRPEDKIAWEQSKLIALIEDATIVAEVQAFLKVQQSLEHINHYEMHEVPEQDWVRASLDLFVPTKFGKRLWICPSWCTPKEPEAVNVLFDPGLAFGTGSHATTALCLAWLDEHIQGGESVIDYGCGSGILAVSSLKLGVTHVTAVDHEEQALIATRANAELNGITEQQLVTCLPQNFVRKQVDILLANILAQPLIELAPMFAELVREDGWVVLSGILESQIGEIQKVYEKWFQLEEPVLREGWVRIEGKKYGAKVIRD